MSIDWQQLMAKLMASPSSLTPEEIAILKITPAVTPPLGVVSDFANPPTIKNIQYGITSPLMAFMLLVSLNRFYVKTFLMKKYGWDDLTLVLSVIGTLVYFSVTIWGCERGRVGVHLWDINVLDSISEDFMVPSYILVIVPNIVFGLVKTTFFLLYLQLFRQLYWIRISIYVGLALNTAVYIAFTIALFYFATPRPGEKLYTHDLRASGELAVPVSAVGLVMDVIVLVIPIVAISGLQTSTRKKVGAILIFLSGLLACICSALSIYYRIRLDSNTRGSDITYKLIGVYTSSYVPSQLTQLAEMMIGVMCACMPSLAYSYRHIPAVQSLKKSVSSYFSASERTKQSTKYSSAGGTIGSMGQNFPAIGKTNDVYIAMEDYHAHTTRSASLGSHSEMVDYKHRDGPQVYDERGLQEIFDGSGHLIPEGPRSEYSEERARVMHSVV
ncbi:hypothetical protein P171DRAFT_441295 [Karstenula rhodostoma CBS 690.94]|uniref:Rhodopsin domain-containing protein n=1 Tax=Karstenula rhodostoma CBS 690.94 TaxID=1392251 RepID=A0A9P4PRP8_9PLEO|nr:hypothetical protein P171DRAFT_441295 [Karstenula rhodostoma CBS 690.94]